MLAFSFKLKNLFLWLFMKENVYIYLKISKIFCLILLGTHVWVMIIIVINNKMYRYMFYIEDNLNYKWILVIDNSTGTNGNYS